MHRDLWDMVCNEVSRSYPPQAWVLVFRDGSDFYFQDFPGDAVAFEEARARDTQVPDDRVRVFHEGREVWYESPYRF